MKGNVNTIEVKSTSSYLGDQPVGEQRSDQDGEGMGVLHILDDIKVLESQMTRLEQKISNQRPFVALNLRRRFMTALKDKEQEQRGMILSSRFCPQE